MRPVFILLLGLSIACGDDDVAPFDGGPQPDVGASDSATPDGGPDTGPLPDGGDDAGGDDGGMTDGGPDAGPADVGVDAGPPPCGMDQPSVASISGTEGVAITADGTMYFSQGGGIGRMLPGMDPDPGWITGLGGTMWGLAYRESDGMLFAASPSGGGVIYSVDTNVADASAESHITGAGAPNGLIVADDGSILYSDFGGDRVMRSVDGATPTMVASVTQPNGLFIDDDGTLLVLSYGPGRIFRVTLTGDWTEESREMVADIDARPDGIGKDDMGRYYITDNGNGRLLRYNTDFGAEEELLTGVPSAANVAWGQGPLVCTELYVTSGGTMRVLDVGARGRP